MRESHRCLIRQEAAIAGRVPLSGRRARLIAGMAAALRGRLTVCAPLGRSRRSPNSIAGGRSKLPIRLLETLIGRGEGRATRSENGVPWSGRLHRGRTLHGRRVLATARSGRVRCPSRATKRQTRAVKVGHKGTTMGACITTCRVGVRRTSTSLVTCTHAPAISHPSSASVWSRPPTQIALASIPT